MDATGNYNNLLVVEASSKEDRELFRAQARSGNASKDSLKMPFAEESDAQSDYDVSRFKPESCKSAK